MINNNSTTAMYKMFLTIGMTVVLLSGVKLQPAGQPSNDNSVDQTTEVVNRKIQFHDLTYDISDLTLAGDVLLTKEQIDDEVTTVDRRRRAVVSPPQQGYQLWKDGIVPYVFNIGMTDEQKMVIKRRMRFIERRTCVKFVEHTFLDRPQVFLAVIVGTSCFSHVGSGNNFNMLSLKFPECFKPNIMFHELLHTLGLYHEQQRMDRDEYVKINWDNIEPGQEYNFRMMKTFVNLGQGYDKQSVMHYKSSDFSKNGKPTIECLNGNSAACKLGSQFIRWSDISQINSMYKCPITTYGRKGRC